MKNETKNGDLIYKEAGRLDIIVEQDKPVAMLQYLKKKYSTYHIYVHGHLVVHLYNVPKKLEQREPDKYSEYLNNH
jgi:hypothetical protein